jgi:hypothetical protein
MRSRTESLGDREQHQLARHFSFEFDLAWLLAAQSARVAMRAAAREHGSPKRHISNLSYDKVTRRGVLVHSQAPV